MSQESRWKNAVSPLQKETFSPQERTGREASHPRLMLFALCLGYFMVIMDITVVNVAMPDIQTRLGATVSGLQWIVAGYSLIFASLLLTAGMLGDRLGSKRIFLAGLALFTFASALCGLAPNLLAFQLFRLLQGLGAALMVPASLALISHTIIDPTQRARAIGIWGAIAGIAAASGPVLGWMSPLILSMFVLFILAAALFILCEKRAVSPMLPLSLFARATFSVSNLVGLLLNFGFYGQFFVINLYFPHIRGYSPQVTGLALLPESCMVFVGSMFAGRIIGRTGPRLPMVLGLTIGGLGMLDMSLVQASTAFLLICPALLATGFGTAFTMPAMTTAVIASAPGERSGTASGVLNASRQMGQVLGTALLGSLVADQDTFLSGMHSALLIAGTAFLLGCCLSAIFVRNQELNR
jgi:MFS transporter, DHA2 family, methylenomycin A resistance protein